MPAENQPTSLSKFVKDSRALNYYRWYDPEYHDVCKDLELKAQYASNVIPTRAGINSEGIMVAGDEVTISADFTLPPEEFGTLLHDALTETAKLHLSRNAYDLQVVQQWESADFLQENSLLPNTYRENVRAINTVIHPTEPSMTGNNKSVDTAEIVIERGEMRIAATGPYKQYLRDLSELLKPTTATFNFSSEDAAKIMILVQRNAFLRPYADILNNQLQPQESFAISIDHNNPGAIYSVQSINVTTTTDFIAFFEDALEIDLYNPNQTQGSRIVQLTKLYPLDLLRRRVRLRDMQAATRFLDQLYFGPNNGFAVSDEQAKELLDQDLDVLQSMYEEDSRNFSQFGPNIHNSRGHAVRKLAVELVGKELVQRRYDLTVDEYVSMLATHGYITGHFTPCATLPEYSIKERHLLEFYKQLYSQDPTLAVSQYRNAYRYSRPSVAIDVHTQNDASQEYKVKIAPKAKLYSFSLRENYKKGHLIKNELGIKKNDPQNSQATLWSRTNGNNPDLVKLQDFACEKIGIIFSN